MDTDRNLLFGVLALQADVITHAQFVEACTLWANQKSISLSDLLVERGWITAADRADVDRLVERKLRKHGGDAKAGLAELSGDGVQRSLAAVADPDIRNSLAALPSPGHVLVATVAYQPESRDRYTLSRLHAHGGIGQVWVAHDSAVGRDVALKELRSDRADNPAVWARFLEEAQITGQLEHPGIVPVYELGQHAESQRPFYTMRFIRGRTLSEAVKGYHRQRAAGQAGRLELRELLGAFVGVCNAVAYAHSRGVIHRDLKGPNVVLGDFGEVMVLDWGLAKVLSGQGPQPGPGDGQAERPGPAPSAAVPTPPASSASTLPPVSVEKEASREETMHGQVLGTPGYMPPEQAEGRLDLVDQRSDVYGLGAILYEILTGRPPFTGDDTPSLICQIIYDPPARPRQVVPATPLALEAVCLKALSKRPADRYASAGELAREVQRWLADEPVAAYREPLATRLGRWARRHKPAVAGAAVLLLTAVVALSASTVLISREQRQTEVQRQRAEVSFRQARQAVDEYFTKVSESKLLNVPGLQPLRKELLEAALKYYQQFLDQRGDDPTLHRDLSKTWFRVGLITNDVGAKPDALAAYQKARDQQEELLRDHPGDAQLQSDLAETCWHMGELERWSGQYAPALRSYQRSRDLRDQLVRAQPDIPAHQNALAKSYAGLGELYEFTDRSEEAVGAYRKARDLGETLVRQNPKNSQFQRDLADSCRRLGEVQMSLEQHAQALSSLDRAIELFGKLAQEKPPYPDDQYHHGWSHAKKAACQRQLGDLSGAVLTCAQARDILEKLARDNPTMTEYRNGVANSYLQLGILQRASGQLQESLRSFRQACEELEKVVHDHPTLSVYQLNLARSYPNLARAHALLGQPAETVRVYQRARGHLEKLVREYPTIPEYEYELARGNWALGKFHVAGPKPDEASRCFQQALSHLEKLCQHYPDRATFHNLLAWYLATCPAAPVRNATHAVESAKKAVALAPKVGNFVNTLGVAHYRAGDWKAAVTTLEQSTELRAGGTSEDFFFLAMAHWRLDQKDQAQKWYAKALEWMMKHNPEDEELTQFRAEAAALLGVPITK
jgi:serine/threonine protein kinase/tetratricopeptide (TPR) repeat protein